MNLYFELLKNPIFNLEEVNEFYNNMDLTYDQNGGYYDDTRKMVVLDKFHIIKKEVIISWILFKCKFEKRYITFGAMTNGQVRQKKIEGI